ncbi:MAG TPA: hypothetical protein PK205_13065 [Promineifilum sp.]|nr:hypothetical protein [Promineifilum sp.]HRO25037.1 hypothetical protein [Promineifilum sp.]HRO91019.1 hypothetical protein [Promineifilum sp.]HRQ14097.1 hypothetical protein [Promineifilum sp.]HRQ14229.1 hypothetical protein [Promineifilum sp.]
MGKDVPAAVALEEPAFLYDDDLQADAVGQKIQDEAGIAAYYKAPNALNLEFVRPLFNSIELESADYILGSISVPSYAEHFDTHVYIRRDGWIMAYYLSSAPASKMIETKAGSLNNSKLTIVMNNIAVTGGAPFGAVTYYNFNHPNATHMLLVGESDYEEFQITIPSVYSYYEISWASKTHEIRIDGQDLTNIPHGYGLIPITSFLPDITHTIHTGYDWNNGIEYGALVIVYRMP